MARVKIFIKRQKHTTFQTKQGREFKRTLMFFTGTRNIELVKKGT